MKRRGISPLISWVLLFGFAVAMGALIFGWAIRQAENQEIVVGPDIYCNDVSISLVNCTFVEGDYINVNILNKGKWSLRRIGAHIESSNYPLSTCVYLLSDANKVVPGEKRPFIFRLDTLTPINDPTCNFNLDTPATSYFLIKDVEIIPYIMPTDEKEVFACPDSKIIVPKSACV